MEKRAASIPPEVEGHEVRAERRDVRRRCARLVDALASCTPGKAVPPEGSGEDLPRVGNERVGVGAIALPRGCEDGVEGEEGTNGRVKRQDCGEARAAKLRGELEQRKEDRTTTWGGGRRYDQRR